MADLLKGQQELKNEIERMKEEGKIEAANSKIENVSPSGGGNINPNDSSAT